MGRAIGRYLDAHVNFGVGDAADLAFSAGGVDCLVEVKHDRAPAPWVTVFYPDSVDVLATLATAAHGGKKQERQGAITTRGLKRIPAGRRHRD